MIHRTISHIALFLALVLASSFVGSSLFAAEIPSGAEGYTSHVKAFFKTNCLRCHGPEASKGDITLHTMDGDLSAGIELDRWEMILEMLLSGEMPPEDEPQPDEADRAAVANWIEAGLREYVNQASRATKVTTLRRLTNFEYQNTLRDLLGFELLLTENLPKDPVKPYKFNNTAQYMLIGPEQIDRYLECARRAMASAIVDPSKPEIHTTTRKWTSQGSEKGLGADEVGVWGNRRFTPANGMGLKSFPQTGEFRVRIKASAILSAGVEEVPLRLVMGYDLNTNSSTLRIRPIGIMHLRNSPDDPQVFEFRGRIENYPPKPGRTQNGKQQQDSLTITPQNLYDDGTLNDDNNFQRTRNVAMPRAVVEWIEFEAPIADTWPPEHHTRILFESSLREEDPKAYAEEVLRRFLSRAYRRPATQEEVARFATVYQLLLPELGSLEAAMRETLAMVLISPQFLYHTESDNTEGSQQYAMASKLSYFLWGSMPDEELLQLAAKGDLNSPKVIDAQVSRMLADPRSLDFVDNFTTQWMCMAKMKTVPINRELFPRFLYYVPFGERAGTEVPYRPTIRDYMHEETVGFVAELIKRNASILNIVDSDFAYLNQPLAAHYRVEGVTGVELRTVPVKPEHHLGGLLTQGSMLIGNSTGSAPHPIYRAVWLREAILGDEVKPPPADVPALSDSTGNSAEKALTIKNLLAKHRQKESCKDCHVRLDPWGIPFERYNAIGRFQPKVPKEGVRVSGFNKQAHQNLAGYEAYLDSINTEEIEADSTVPHGPRIDGMQELKTYLLAERREDVAKNVIRRLLSYGLGRELNFHDRFAVEQIAKQAKVNDYKLRDMIITICQSELFRGIKPEDN